MGLLYNVNIINCFNIGRCLVFIVDGFKFYRF